MVLGLDGPLRDDELEYLKPKSTTIKKAETAPAKKAPAKTSTKAPAKTTSTKKAPAKKAPAKAASSSSGGGGAAYTPPKSTDKSQLAALDLLLKSGFASARDVKIGNIRRIYAQQDAEIMRGYNTKLNSLQKVRQDNELDESDSTFANLANRARETTDLLAQSASQGAGETDTLRSQLMSLRNWNANQNEVNRAFFDTQRSVNTAIGELNSDTRGARVGAAVETLGDYEQVWTNYYNQRADAYSQRGNVTANPYSDSHDPKANDYGKMAKEASSAWKNPGVSKTLTDWRGWDQPKETKLNSANLNLDAPPSQKQIKRPEGSTLRKW